MSNELSNQISSSLSAQGRGTMAGAQEARGTFLEAIQPPPEEDVASLADVLSKVNESVAYLDYKKATEVKARLWGLAENTADYKAMPVADQERIRNGFMTQMTQKGQDYINNLDPNDPNNKYILESYGTFEAMRQGKQVDISGWDSFGKAVLRMSATAGMGLLAVDALNENDVRESMLGTAATEMDDIMIQAAGRYAPGEAADYKRGKIFGNIAGIGLDMASSVAFGAVTGLTKTGLVLGSKAAMAIGTGSKMARATGAAVKFLIPNTLEATLFIAEDTVYKTVNNELDFNEDLGEIIKGVPGSFLKGLIYASAGEIVLGGIVKTLKKGIKGTAGSFEKITGKAANKGDRAAIKSLTSSAKPGTIQEAQRISRELLSDLRTNKWSPEMDTLRLKKYMDEYGWSEEGAVDQVRRMREASFLKDADTWTDDLEMTRQGLVQGWGADVEITPSKDFMFKRFAGAELDTPIVVRNTPEDLGEFFHNHYEPSINKVLDDINLGSGMKVKDVQVELTSAHAGSTSVKINGGAVNRMFRPASEVVDGIEYQKLVDTLIPDSGLKVELVEPSKIFENFQPKKGVIQVPNKITSNRAGQKTVDSFLGQISEAATEGGKRVSISGKSIKRYLGTGSDLAYNKSFFKKLKHSLEVRQDGDKFIAKIKGTDFSEGGKVVKFNSEKEAIDYIAPRVHAEAFGGITGVQEALGRRGIDIKMKKGRISVKVNGDDYGEFDNLSELLSDKSLRPGLPYESKPQFMEIGLIGDGKPSKTYLNEGVGVEGTILGINTGLKKEGSTIQQMAEEYKSWEKVGTGNYKVKDTGIEGVDVFTDGMKVTVTVPETGFMKEFPDPLSAKAYLDDFKNRYDNILNRGSDAGFVVRPTKAGWAVVNDVEINHFKSIDDVDQFLALDSISNVRDLASPFLTRGAYQITAETSEAVAGVKKGLKETTTKRAIETEAQKGNKWRQIKDRWMKQTGARINDTGDIAGMTNYHRLQNSYRGLENETRIIQGKLDTIYKGVSDDQLNFMGLVLSREIDATGWEKAIGEMNEAMKTKYKVEEIVPYLQKTRDLLDQGGVLFGMDGKKYIQNYAPRLGDRDFAHAMDVSADKMFTGPDAFTNLLSQKVPPQDIPFFMYARTDELGTGLMDVNIRSMVETYYNIGNRSVYMKEPMDQLKKSIKAKEISPDNVTQLKQMIDSINGRVVDTPSANAAHALNTLKQAQKTSILGGHEMLTGPNGEKISMEKVFEQAVGEGGDFGSMARKIEAVNDKDSANKVFSSMVNGALMAYNMRMPVRNVGQIFTNLSPTLGIRTTNKAFIDVIGSKKLRARLQREMIGNGVMHPDVKIGKPTNIGKGIEGYANIGMYVFRRSDDLTRMVAMRASEIRATGAIDNLKNAYKLSKGKLSKADLDNFIHDGHIDYLDESVQARLVDMATGNSNAAGIIDEVGIKALMGREFTTMTMYDYTPHIRPEKFKGGMGNILGKMGTWPVAYFDLFKRGVKARPVEFTTKVVMAQAAVAMFYNDVLDMNGVPYTPLGNMAFTGGPAFTGFPKSLQAAFSGSAKILNGDIKGGAGDIINGASWFLPGHKQYRSAVKGWNSFQEAEYYDTALYLLGANPEWNQPGLSRFYKNLEPEDDFNLTSWADALKPAFIQ